ncbi:hypothetical protein [Paractinoplanes toevensis]|uniref:Uncharacterized protein n=1 Tax=Paractinoplanes toevensis TaxID=571911 RepID=A0A919TDM9_9ACTN|nr:hypothetical protein [Actinoplanes toevensis]GIM92171.1 hypothetical protein Ato02nite_039640 [Actinoplanes toevensis]
MPASKRRRLVTIVAAATAGVLTVGTVVAAGQLNASAAESSRVGLAGMNGGTAGGSSGTVVTVTTAVALKTAPLGRAQTPFARAIPP